MSPMSKKDADAYDRLLDAAGRLADIITAGGVAIEEGVLEELTVFLAEHSLLVSRILRDVRYAGLKAAQHEAGIPGERAS